MKYDLKYLKDVLANCDKVLQGESLKKFILEMGAYISEIYSIDTSIFFGILEGAPSTFSTKKMDNGSYFHTMFFDIHSLYHTRKLEGEDAMQLPSMVNLMETIAHEMRLVLQTEYFQKTKGVLNDTLLMAKESFCFFPSSYSGTLKRGYDAEIEGWHVVSYALSELSPINYKKYQPIIQKEIERLKDKEKRTMITTVIDGKEETLPMSQFITIAATRTIQKNPKAILETRPILNIVYHPDGTKKDLATLTLEKQVIIDHIKSSASSLKDSSIRGVIDLYDAIINSDRDLLIQKKKSFTGSSSDEGMFMEEEFGKMVVPNPKVRVYQDNERKQESFPNYRQEESYKVPFEKAPFRDSKKKPLEMNKKRDDFLEQEMRRQEREALFSSHIFAEEEEEEYGMHM